MADEKQKNIFLEKLDYLLELNKVSKKELCDATGISRSTLDNWYTRNQTGIKRKDLALIADFFHISMYYLCVDECDNVRLDPNASPFANVLDKEKILTANLEQIKESFEFTSEEIEQIRSFIEFMDLKRKRSKAQLEIETIN